MAAYGSRADGRRRWKVRGALLLALMAAWSLSGHRGWALRQPAERGPRVQVYALWNRSYLCLAAKVPDTMVTGMSTGPMSAPEQDDAVEFSFEVPGERGPSAYRLVISAAGGMTLLGRDARGGWRTDPSWISGPRTVKYAVSIDGTLNDPSDRDRSFLVECAIPWEFLGGDPPAGAEIGFNVVCCMQGENDGVASWSPMVRSPEHVGDAARWGRMVMKPSSTLEKARGMVVLCPYVGQTPFVDGKLEAGEWLVATSLEFSKPEPVVEPAPPAERRAGAAAFLMAIYRYDWQGNPDGRGGALLWSPEGAPATGHQPQRASGPWCSYERVDWHAAQLEELQRAGVDIILLRYAGEDRARRTWARSGIDRLVQALKERRAAGLGYPLVGMMLDVQALNGADLKSEVGRRRIYGMIREFFLRVPREFWAEIGARPEEGQRGGVPVFLGEPEGLADWDGEFVRYCQGRLAEDFGGARPIWVGSSAWRSRGGEGFHSYISLPARTGFVRSATGGASTVALSPGRCPSPGSGGEIRPRRDTSAYRTDWQRTLAVGPELVVIDSWNDFENGTEICPSRQYGVAYVDMTRYFQSRLGEQQSHPLRLKQQRVPRLLKPGAEYVVEFLVENLSTEDVRTGRRVSVDYEIVRRSDGKVVQSRKAAQGLDVPAGATRRLAALIAARDDGGHPLPPGDYIFSLSVMRSKVAYLRSEWFARTIANLAVPITVGVPNAHRAEVMSTSLPSALESGAMENVVVRLRNDGSATWRPGETRLSYHWVRYRDDLALPSAEAREMVVWETARAELPAEVAPGEVVSVMIPVTAATAQGDPLTPVDVGELWHYRVQWDLVEGEDVWFSAEEWKPAEEAIDVVAHDPGLVFQSAFTPVEMHASERVGVELSVANASRHEWRSGRSYVTCRWYRWDGRPVPDSAIATHLPSDLEPGGELTMEASLAAPSAPGPYWVAWEGARSGQEEVVRGGRRRDLAVSPVYVRGSRVRHVDLTSLANVVAVTTEAYRARGDFDGRGRSLPAEWLAPDLSGPREQVYPSGYYAPGDPKAEAPFVFPETSSGAGGCVACAGQSIPLGDAGGGQVHLLLASTAGTGEAAFGLARESGEVDTVAAVVPSWTERVEGVPVGAYTPYVRSSAGDDASTAAYLYHVTLSVPSGKVVSLELPQAPWIKIVAVTVEDA